MLIAEVILDLSSSYNRHTYSYIVPPDLADKVKPGGTVIVPVRARENLGYVVELTADPGTDRTLRQIIEVVGGAAQITLEQLELSRWLADHYLCGLNESLKLVRPSAQRHRLTPWLIYQAEPSKTEGVEQKGVDDPALHWIISRAGRAREAEVEKEFGRGAVERLLRQTDLRREFTLEDPPDKPKMVEFAKLAGDPEAARGPKERAIMRALEKSSPKATRALLQECDAARTSLRGLARKELIELFKQPQERAFDTSFINPLVKKIVLSAEQKTAVEQLTGALAARTYRSFLLEGVTGSGKTEVYMAAADAALSAGRAALFLVPEIALLPQLVERLALRFGPQVAVIHSGLATGQRNDMLRAVAAGRKRVIVGARSALFSPIKELGLIVIDEEHETSYKQNSAPRYDAREAAKKLAELHQAVVVFGSATPSLETGAGLAGTDSHLTLKNRVGEGSFPSVTVVDMRIEVGQGNYGVFSRRLIEDLQTTLDNGHKAILLMNRRGYAGFTVCRHCGYVPECDNCSISLTYHQNGGWLRCHHCGAARRPLEQCPKCAKEEWRFPGVGTQRVESELNERLPDATVVRMDADTTGQQGAHRDQLLRFHQAERAILLGTQMVAKGLDFPEVALVGIINADTALNLPDFRAAERTAQLIIQVSGRSGRGNVPGEVLVQTFNPDNYAVQAAVSGYSGFFQRELAFRRDLGYPPYTSMFNIIFSSPKKLLAQETAETVAKRLRSAIGKQARFLGPAPAPIERVKGYYRFHLVLTTTQPESVKKILREDSAENSPPAGVRIIMDVDPVWLL